MEFIKSLFSRVDSMFTRTNQNGWSADRFWFHISYATVTYAVIKISQSIAAHPTEALIYALCVLILIYLAIVAGSKLGSKILFLIAQIKIGAPDANKAQGSASQAHDTKTGS